MREIKFRAWDTRKKKMLLHINTCGGLSDFFSNMRVINDGFGRMCLMQYTGLKDKNGKEIFEGDILKHQYEFKAELKERKVTVRWNEQEAAFIPFGFHIHACKGIDVEIIGNIYENPELLKEIS